MALLARSARNGLALCIGTLLFTRTILGKQEGVEWLHIHSADPKKRYSCDVHATALPSLCKLLLKVGELFLRAQEDTEWPRVQHGGPIRCFC